MLRVLVVGGAGVVGSHLVDRLLSEDHEVVAVDDLSRGSFANLAHLRRSERFAFIEHDVTLPYRATVDRVFHLATPSTRMACEPDPVKALMTCVLGVRHALDVAAEGGARVVLATATDRWGAGVRCAETLVADFAKTRGTDVRIARLPSAYGPRMAPDGDHIVTSLVLQALRREKLVPHVRLDRRLRLSYVDDVVDALIGAMNTPEPAETVAPAEEVSVLDLAHLIAQVAGLADDVEIVEPYDSGPLSAPASVRTPLAPSVDLAEGIARTVRWFESRTASRTERTSGVYLSSDPARRRAG